MAEDPARELCRKFHANNICIKFEGLPCSPSLFIVLFTHVITRNILHIRRHLDPRVRNQEFTASILFRHSLSEVTQCNTHVNLLHVPAVLSDIASAVFLIKMDVIPYSSVSMGRTLVNHVFTL